MESRIAACMTTGGYRLIWNGQRGGGKLLSRETVARGMAGQESVVSVRIALPSRCVHTRFRPPVVAQLRGNIHVHVRPVSAVRSTRKVSKRKPRPPTENAQK